MAAFEAGRDRSNGRAVGGSGSRDHWPWEFRHWGSRNRRFSSRCSYVSPAVMRLSVCTVLSCLFAVVRCGDEAGEKEARELDVEPPRVRLSSGAKLMGKYSRTRDKRRRVAEFWGIPYALPPVSQRRFAVSFKSFFF